MITYKPAHIANFFIDKANDEGDLITQMKLMKLVYIGFGWVKALLDRDLFPDEIEAWRHGPVIPALYHEFKHFGSRPITDHAIEFDLDSMETQIPRIKGDDEKVKLILEKVWNIYKRFSAKSLRDKTHEAGTPWSSAYEPGMPSQEIDKNTIKDHFIYKIDQYLNV